MSDRDKCTANQDSRGSDGSRGSQASQQGADPSRRNSGEPTGRTNPVSDDLRDAPGYEAGRRATDRGAGFQAGRREDERRDAAASDRDVAHVAENHDVESDGFYGSAGSAGSAGSDGSAGSAGSDASPGSNAGHGSEPEEVEIFGGR